MSRSVTVLSLVPCARVREWFRWPSVFAGAAGTAPLNERLVGDIRLAGGRAALVGAKSDLSPFQIPAASARLLPLLEILPVQMLSLALAAIAGREPGRFERATKVTTVA